MLSTCPSCLTQILHEDHLKEVRCEECGTSFPTILDLNLNQDDTGEHFEPGHLDPLPKDFPSSSPENQEIISAESVPENTSDFPKTVQRIESILPEIVEPSISESFRDLDNVNIKSETEENLADEPLRSVFDVSTPETKSRVPEKLPNQKPAPTKTKEPVFGSEPDKPLSQPFPYHELAKPKQPNLKTEPFVNRDPKLVPPSTPQVFDKNTPFSESAATFQDIINFGNQLGSPNEPAIMSTPPIPPVQAQQQVQPSSPQSAGAKFLMTAGDTFEGYTITAYLSPVSIVCEFDPMKNAPLQKGFESLWAQAKSCGGNGIIAIRWSLFSQDTKVLLSGTAVKCTCIPNGV